jgi:predicted Holliday junction resolvase-like endonuclease
MAINTQKFLPSSKGGSLTKASKTIAKNSFSLSLSDTSLKNVDIIRVKVIEIDKILKGTIASQKKDLDNKKREASTKRREKLEEKLETKPKAEKEKITMQKTPKMGFLDWIKNFIGNIILGYFAVSLIDHLPKMKGIISFIGSATDFVINVGGKLLDGLVTFIDWGYKAYDATRGFVKNLFGDNGVKQFEQLSSLLNKFLNFAIIAGMVAAGSGGFGRRGSKGGAARPRPGTGGRPKVTTSGGGRAGGIRNPLKQNPKITSGGSGQLKLPGTAVKVTTSGGKRALLSSVRPFLKNIRLPVIGALIDFGLSIALGENPGRAAFRAIGAGILGTIGAGLAGVLGLAGGPLAIATAALGSIAGGTLGDMAGGALYDLFFGGKQVKSSSNKMAGGGVTRGGKKKGGVKRTLSRQKGRYVRKVARKPEEVQITPGSDVGGEDKILGLFPNPLKFAQQAVDMMNPFKIIQNAGKNLGKSDYFGPILAITSKILLGQKPSQKDYDNVGLGINLLLSKGISEGKLRGGIAAAFAEGGLVDPQAISAITEGGDISSWVAKAFKDATDSNAQKTLKEIQDNLKLKKPTTDEPSQPTQQSPDSLESGPAGSSGDALTMARNLMRDLGLTEAQSAGIVGNMIAESGVENARPQGTPPGTKGPLVVDGSTGYGIVQWTSIGRQRALYNFAKSMGHDMSKPLPMNIEYKFFLKEFRENYGSVLNQIKQARDVKTASTIFMQQYEIPAGYKTQTKIMERYNLSQPLYDKLISGQGKATDYAVTDRISPTISANLKGYSVTRSGTTIKDYSQLPPHHTYQTTADGRRVQDFTLYKGNQFVNIPVPSPVSGKVTWTGPSGGGGNWVEIQSDSGKVELGHFNKIIARPGQSVQAFKSILGLQGYTGNISPPGPDGTHVHIQAPDKIVSKYVNTLASGASYEKGGPTLDGPHTALIGEKGREFVIDSDSTKAIEDTFPGFLGAINNAKYKDAINVLRNFASYEFGGSETIIIPSHQMDEDNSDQYGHSSNDFLISNEDSEFANFDSLYMGG